MRMVIPNTTGFTMDETGRIYNPLGEEVCKNQKRGKYAFIRTENSVGNTRDAIFCHFRESRALPCVLAIPMICGFNFPRSESCGIVWVQAGEKVEYSNGFKN